MNRKYELIYLVSPDASDEQVADLHTQVDGIVQRLGGQLEKTDNWGRRRLAYEISRHKEATYVLEHINGSGEMLTIDDANALAGPAAERAIALAPDLPEAWVAMGLQTYSRILYTKNINNNQPTFLQEAEVAFERALSLNPNNLAALETYALYRLGVGALCRGSGTLRPRRGA